MTNKRIEISRNDIIFFGVFAIVLHYAFMTLSARWIENDITYFEASPMAYRLFSYVVIWLSQYANIAIVVAVSFLISMSVVWIFIRNSNELPLIMFGVVIVCICLRLADAPMYVLLVLLAKTKRPEILMPLVLVKEIVFVLGFGYLLLFCKNTKKILIFGVIAMSIYLIFRFIIVGDRPTIYSGGSIFLLPMIIEDVFNTRLSSLIYRCGIAIALIVSTIQNRRELVLALLLFIPILLFSVAWEPHHWFMLTVLLVAHRMYLSKTQEGTFTEHKPMAKEAERGLRDG